VLFTCPTGCTDVAFTSGSSGGFNVTDIRGDINVSNITINAKDIDGFLQANDQLNVTINLEKGIVTVEDINFTFPDNHNITIEVNTSGNSNVTAASTTQTIIGRFSNYFRTLADTIVGLEWLIRSVNATSVQPVGQVNNTPLFNVTSFAHLDTFNFSISLNDSIDASINITAETSFDGCDGSNITQSFTQFATQTPVFFNNGTFDIYLCANFHNTNFSAFSAFIFNQFFYDTICDTCVRTYVWSD